jgi:hypothetical protein
LTSGLGEIDDAQAPVTETHAPVGGDPQAFGVGPTVALGIPQNPERGLVDALAGSGRNNSGNSAHGDGL